LFVWHDTNIDQSTRCALVARRVAIGLLQLAASPWEADTLCSSNQVSALPRTLYCVFECNGRDLIVLARVSLCVRASCGWSALSPWGSASNNTTVVLCNFIYVNLFCLAVTWPVCCLAVCALYRQHTVCIPLRCAACRLHRRVLEPWGQLFSRRPWCVFICLLFMWHACTARCSEYMILTDSKIH
jgi:hypothetical protein